MNFRIPGRKVLVLGFGLAMSAAAITPTFSQEVAPEHLSAAKRAIAATQATKRLDNILPTIASSIKNQLILSRPDLEAQLSDIVDSATIELAGRRGDLENEIARIYTTIFTVEDLDGIAAFYESQAGQKLLLNAPVLARQVDGASKTWTAGVNRDIRAAVDKKIAEAGLKQ